jgi:molybdopterin-containing oxidoreductase family membrane subunit
MGRFSAFNFKSIFAWNIILYNGFLAIIIVYIWFMMERKMNAYYPYAGFAAFIWRLVLTTGTGSIFGFLVSRAAYDTAILAPLFISLSLSLGTAVFLMTLMAVSKISNRELGDGVVRRLSRLLGVFVALTFYFVVVYHLSNAYLAKETAFESFILFTGNPYPMLLWFGFGVVGTLLPLLLIYTPQFDRTPEFSVLAAFLVMLGAFCLLYVIIIGGQAFPLEIFSGKEVLESSFGDANKVHTYAPTIWEILLGLAGIAIALIATLLASWVLPFLPETLSNTAVDPHLK